MAKRKLVPEYEFAISKDANIQKGVISNIFAGLKESDKRFFKGISDLKLSNSNNGAITLADVARNFIRKNSDDVVDGELSFTKGIKSDNYDNGFDGIGYKLYKDEFGKGNLEIDKLTVRDQLFTKLLTYEKINAIGGTLILSAAWCEVTRSEFIEADDYTNNKIKCYYIPDGVSAQMWMVGDQIRLQSSADRFLMTYVTDVSTTANSDGEFMIELYYGNEEDSQQQGATIPQQGDTLVQWGYRGIESHPERQNIIIISSGNSDVTYPYIEQYEGIDDFSLTGKLISRISHDVYFGNAAKTKYLWWNKEDNGEFLIKGTLTQSASDETFPITVYRGVWEETTYYKGDIVTSLGTTYICIVASTVDEPPTSDWEIYAAGGDTGSVGQTVRYSKWILGNTYFAGNINDGGTNNNPNRYIDYVTNLGTDGIVRAYKCDSYHVATSGNEPKTAGSSAQWSPISYLPALASDLLLAKQAVIGGFVFSEAIDASGNQIAPSAQYMRTTDSHTAPATILRGDGSGHLAKGNIIWDEDGNAEVIGSANLAGGKFIANSDGTLTLEFETIVDEKTTRRITISNVTGVIESRIDGIGSSVARVSTDGLFANRANENPLPPSLGISSAASVVGLGWGDISLTSNPNGFLCGVYGAAINNSSTPAPSFGGYFNKLKANGLYGSVRSVSATTNLDSSDTIITCYNTSNITLYLPTSPYIGHMLFFKLMNAVQVTLDGGANSIFTNVVTATYANSTKGQGITLFWDGSYWILGLI